MSVIQITGLPSVQTINQSDTIHPFSLVTITDPTPGLVETVIVTLDNSVNNVTYTINGFENNAITAVRNLTFRPTQPGGGVRTDLLPNSNYSAISVYEGVHLGGGVSTVNVAVSGVAVTGDSGEDYIIDNGFAGYTEVTAAKIVASDTAGNSGTVTGSIRSTISTGTTIILGTGKTTVNVTGGDPIVYGSSTSGSLLFSGGAGAATVYAGAGATSIFANAGGGQFFGGNAAGLLFVGGAGKNLMFGGSSGRDLLVAGTGASTVVGSGDGVVIVGLGNAGDVLVAGSGAETLVGSAGGGNDILFGGAGFDAMFAGTGNNTLVAAPAGAQMFASTVPGAGEAEFIFSNGAAGGVYTLWNFRQGTDHVAMFGYGPNAVANALAGAAVGFGSTTVTLSDNSRITFANITNLKASAFL